MHDVFAHITEADLRLPDPPLPLCAPRDEWWRKFQYNLYDWDDAAFKRKNRGKFAWKPIQLTRGYFMMVSPRDFKRMYAFPDGRQKRWRLKLDVDRCGEVVGAYGRRVGRKGELDTVYAHRELVSLYARNIVDHVNGWGLDNRSGEYGNLRSAGQAENMSNAVVIRRKNIHLKRGVEPRGKNKKGQPLYGGIRAVRITKKKAMVFRSKRAWTNQDHAAKWYQNQIKMLYRRKAWAHQPKTVNYPVFPPLLKPASSTTHKGVKVGVSLEMTF